MDERPKFTKNIRHSEAEMAQFRRRPIVDQQQFRCVQIESALAESGHDVHELHAVVGRGGLLPPLASGTYLVNDAMLDELRLPGVVSMRPTSVRSWHMTSHKRPM